MCVISSSIIIAGAFVITVGAYIVYEALYSVVSCMMYAVGWYLGLEGDDPVVDDPSFQNDVEVQLSHGNQVDEGDDSLPCAPVDVITTQEVNEAIIFSASNITVITDEQLDSEQQ